MSTGAAREILHSATGKKPIGTLEIRVSNASYKQKKITK